MYYPPQPVVAQTMVAAPPAQMPGDWTTGLFNCFDDPWSCFITSIFPGNTFSKVANIIDKGLTSRCSASCTYFFLLHCNAFTMGLTPWLYTCMYRKKLRMAYNLQEEPCCDVVVHYFCEPCSLCQMYRELQNRGFDMSKDYRQNMKEFAKNGISPPMTTPSMQLPPVMAPSLQPPPMMTMDMLPAPMMDHNMQQQPSMMALNMQQQPPMMAHNMQQQPSMMALNMQQQPPMMAHNMQQQPPMMALGMQQPPIQSVHPPSAPYESQVPKDEEIVEPTKGGQVGAEPSVM